MTLQLTIEEAKALQGLVAYAIENHTTRLTSAERRTFHKLADFAETNEQQL